MFALVLAVVVIVLALLLGIPLSCSLAFVVSAAGKIVGAVPSRL